jgi:hypothetical protein
MKCCSNEIRSYIHPLKKVLKNHVLIPCGRDPQMVNLRDSCLKTHDDSFRMLSLFLCLEQLNEHNNCDTCKD